MRSPEDQTQPAVPDPWVVTVVVLTWNGLDDTLACLESLAAVGDPNLRVIVVDNGSQDGTVEVLRVQHPDVTVLPTGRNLGFAGGNNVGIEHALTANPDAVLLLNNDTYVCATAINELVDVLRSHPDAAACSPVLPYAADPSRLWFAGAPYDPDSWRSARSSRYERGLTPLPDHPVVIDRAAGAAMLVRTQVLRELGGLADELFFLHEDVDWSLRARRAGWHILLAPRARIIHKVATSQGGTPYTPTTAYYGTRNDLEMARRHGRTRGLHAFMRQVGCLGIHLAQLRRVRSGTRVRCLSATVDGWLDYRRRRFGERSPRES